jgi:hypothetical protein
VHQNGGGGRNMLWFSPNYKLLKSITNMLELGFGCRHIKVMCNVHFGLLGNYGNEKTKKDK